MQEINCEEFFSRSWSFCSFGVLGASYDVRGLKRMNLEMG